MGKISHFFQYSILGLIIAIAGVLLFYAAATDSAIFDESAHIPAGYGYVKYFDYRLNHEHPPLVKILSGIPLLFLDPNFPVNKPAWTTDVNGQWQTGADFLYNSGNNADQIVFWARFGPVLLTLLTIIFIYVFASKIIGGWWALLPSFLFGLSPTVLAHGHYVTTDIGATFGVLISFYFLFKYLKNRTGANLLIAGIAFGVAQLTKFSNVLLGPIFILLITALFTVNVIKKWNDTEPGQRFKRFAKEGLRELCDIVAIIVTGLILVTLVYIIFSYNYPQELLLRDMYSVIGNFQPTILRNIAFGIASVPILKPLAVYAFGVYSVLQRTAGGNAAYFLGQLAGKGWWYYFPVIYFFKETIPVLILIAIGFFCWLRKTTFKMINFWDFIRRRFPEFAMAFYVIFYWANSMTAPLNIGMRHIIPTLPFIYILTAMGLKKWVAGRNFKDYIYDLGVVNYLKEIPKIAVKFAFIWILLLWFIAETVFVTPHYLSYYNEFAGGTVNGYRFATDSNYDWGQDLNRLKNWVHEQNKHCSLIETSEPCGIKKIAVDYFGGGSPKYTFHDIEENWWSSRGNPKDRGIEWIAISTNTLMGALAKTTPGYERKPEDEYRWLTAIKNPHKPDARAGYSIFIYKL